MKKQRFISLGLAVAMVTTPLASSIGVEAKGFTDMPTNWAKEPMERAVDNGLLKGHNGKINPKDNLTRAELLAILNRALGNVGKADISSFSDLDENKWYYTEFQKAVKADLVEGSNGKMYPNAPITREEAFVIVGRAFDIAEKTNSMSNFKDNKNVSSWAKDNINGLISRGYLKGSNGNINPKAYITRAEYASIMNELVPAYDKDVANLGKEIKGNLLVKSADTLLKGLKIDGDLILAEGIDNKKILLDGVEVTGRILVRGAGEILLKNGSKADRLVAQNKSTATKVEVSKDSEIKYVDAKSTLDLKGEGKVDQVYLHEGSDKSVISTKGSKIEPKVDGIKYTDDTEVDKPGKEVVLPPGSSSEGSTGGTVTPKPEDKDTITIKPDKDGRATISGNHKNVILDGTFSEVVVNTTSNFKLNIPEKHTGDIDIIKGEGLGTTGRIKIVKGDKNISIILDESHKKVTITKDGFKMDDTQTEYIGVIEFDIRDTEGNPIEGARVRLTHFDGKEATEDDYGVNGKGTIFYSKKGKYNYTVIAPGYSGSAMTDSFEMEEMESLSRIIELEKLPSLAEFVNEGIRNLPELEELTLEDKEKIKIVRDGYEGLSEEEKELVKEELVEKLEALVERMEELEKDEENRVKAKEVENKINDLPLVEDLKLEDRAKVAGVRTALDELTEDQKKLVSEELVNKLKALEEKLTRLEKDEEEKLARIKAVEKLITNLPNVEELTLENKEKVEEAKAELDKLTEDEKALVKEELVKKLEALEGKLVELEEEKAKKEVEKKLNQVLLTSKDYKYDPVYNYNYNKFEIVEDTAELEYKDIAAENPKVVMNDLARYLGAMYRIDNGATVKSIEYKGQVYTWNGGLKGSNWKNENSTLIKVITDDFKENNELRELNLKLVGDFGVEKNVTIKGKLVTDLTPLEPALKVVTVKNEFEITDVEDIRFMVKSITQPGSKEGTTVQKLATLEEVKDHFNNNYSVKNIYDRRTFC